MLSTLLRSLENNDDDSRLSSGFHQWPKWYLFIMQKSVRWEQTKILAFQNQCFLYQSNIFIHKAPMSYLSKNTKWLVMTIVAFNCTFLPSDRFHLTNLPQFSFYNSEKNHSGPTVMLLVIENKIYQNTWNTVFLCRTDLCWDRIHTWYLILKVYFLCIPSDRWISHRIEATEYLFINVCIYLFIYLFI